MPACRKMEENGSCAMLAVKRSAGLTPEVNLWEHITPMPPPSRNKVADPGFKTQWRHHQKSKTGLSVAPQKGRVPTQTGKPGKMGRHSPVRKF